MATYPKSIQIDGAWVGVGGNTPFSKFRGEYIAEIELRDSEHFSAAYVKITFESGTVMTARVNEYQAKYKKEDDLNGRLGERRN